jgi:hypothetical protein
MMIGVKHELIPVECGVGREETFQKLTVGREKLRKRYAKHP